VDEFGGDPGGGRHGSLGKARERRERNHDELEGRG